ncbi:MAG TPA: 1-acyl-sn-glycerol-3-phosphate acyltransferase [Chitinophagaceae bacterium]
MRTGLRFFYRHIYVTGMEHIPSKGPVIIIANHPSSLMDAALLGILLKRKPWFFTRGDVFINRPVQKVLSWFHMIPVHQHEKGRSSLGANDDSFAAAQKILSNNGIIVFFPESTSHVEHQLWPFRKGVFRLAFQTMAAHDFSLQLPIVPIGITYDHPTAGRKSVQVHIGAALQAADYASLYQSNPAAARLHIVKDAQDLMTGHVLHVLRSDRCEVVVQSLLIDNNNQAANRAGAGWKIASREKLEREQDICYRINKASEADLAGIKQRTAVYFNALATYGIGDGSISSRFSFSRWKMILLWVGYPVFLAGVVLNAFPVFVARRIADKKVSRIDFYTWIFTVCYTVLYVIWALLLTAGCWLLFGWQYALILAILAPLTGLFSYRYMDWRAEARQYNKLKRLSARQLSVLKKIRKEIDVLIS